jgi:predicted phosphodiesterase
MHTSPPDIVILHLSDLHFGSYLQGVRPTGKWSLFAPSHDFNLLQGMEVRIPDICLKFNDRLIIVVTGDLTTAAELPAYEAVNNYLRDYPFYSNTLRVGLKLHEFSDRFFVVPGNHDVWFYPPRIARRWERRSNRRMEYSKYFPDLPQAYPLLVNGHSVTIYTIDTNCVRGLNPCNFMNALGAGQVGPDQIAYLQVLHNSLLHNNSKIPEGFDYRNSLKVALMHHHLQVPSTIPNNLEQKLLQLRDAPTVKELLCDFGVHIVLCGHQHFPYQLPDLKSSCNPAHSIFLSCAGSASQIGCDRNSFFVYEISRDDTTYDLDVLQYEANVQTHSYSFRKSPSIPFKLL